MYKLGTKSAALRGDMQPQPTAPTPAMSARAAALRQQNPLNTPVGAVARSPEEEAALQRQIQAQAVAKGRELAMQDQWKGTGILGIAAMLRNQIGKKGREEKYTQQELDRLQAEQGVGNFGTMREQLVDDYESARDNPESMRMGDTFTNPETGQRVVHQYGDEGSSGFLEVPEGYQPDVSTSQGSTAREKWGTVKYEQNPDTGLYESVQYSDMGNIKRTPLPEGFVPPLTSSATDINAGLRDRMRNEEILDIEETADPLAQAAGLEVAAEEAARTEALLLREQQMYDEEDYQKLEQARTEAWSRTSSRESQLEKMQQIIADAKGQARWYTTGFGDYTSWAKGTPGYNLAADLDRLRAVAGIDRLQEMREQAENGASGFGQLTERELARIEDSWANIDQGQTRREFIKSLDDYMTTVEDVWARMEAAYEQEYGVPYFSDRPPTRQEIRDARMGTGAAPAAPAVPTLEDMSSWGVTEVTP